MLKLFLVLGFALGVASCVGNRADAATPDPHTKCNQKVVWSASDTYSPDNFGDTIRWAYLQVAAPTDTTAINNVEQDINWEWQNSLSGSNYSPNQTYLDSNAFGNREFWTHSFDGDILEPDPVKVKERVMRLVVEDFGVKASTSTATGLSVRDRDALKAICKAQAEPAVANPNDEPKRDTKESKEDKANSGDDAGLDVATGTPTPGGGAGLWLLLALLAPLFAYAFAGEKVLALVKRSKSRDDHGYDDEEIS